MKTFRVIVLMIVIPPLLALLLYEGYVLWDTAVYLIQSHDGMPAEGSHLKGMPLIEHPPE